MRPRAALLASAFLLATAAQAEPAAETAEPKLAKEPAVQKTVIDEGGKHIEETRVRGQLTKATVDPKILPKYEILPADGARDLSPAANTSRGAAGQRFWKVLNF